MRFAYIDSQGKEVGIPSVEALQLRIELGAIGENTMFFDASTDKWAPAKEHEIFRTLSRETKDKDEGGFVAPPPPTMLRMQWPPPEQQEEKEEEAPPEEPEPAAEEPPAPAPEPAQPAATEPAQPPAAEPEAPAEPQPEQPPAATPEPEPVAASDGSDFDFGDLGLTPAEEVAEPEPEPAEAPEMTAPEPETSPDPAATPEPEEAAAESGEGGFDFGDFGALDLEPAAEAEAEAEAEPAGTPDMTAPEPDMAPEPTAAGGADQPDTSFDFGGADLEMEGPAQEEETAGAGGGGGMEMEKPLSEYDPDQPPSWMDEEDEASGGLEIEDAAAAAYGGSGGGGRSDRGGPGGPGGRGPGGGGGGGDGDEPRGERPERRPPRARPARPVKKRSKVMPMVLSVVALAAVGAGGWFGWSYLQSQEEAPEPEPEVAIPEIPAYLEPTLEEAAAPAYAAMIDSLRMLSSGLPQEPTEEWLSGNYLANARQFAGVESYWEGLRDHLDRIQEVDEEIFMNEFEERLDSLNMVGEDRTALEERARAGFQAARPDRQIVYDQLEVLIDASLDLHDFLLGNEDAIDYEPALGGLSRDPVTEAVPASEALGEEMWDRVAEITTALDNLGALDRVSTDRVLGIVFDKLERTSIR